MRPARYFSIIQLSNARVCSAPVETEACLYLIYYHDFNSELIEIHPIILYNIC